MCAWGSSWIRSPNQGVEAYVEALVSCGRGHTEGGFRERERGRTCQAKYEIIYKTEKKSPTSYPDEFTMVPKRSFE